MKIVKETWPRAQSVFECTDFRKKFPRDYALVCRTLGVTATPLNAATVAAAWRLRLFWASFKLQRLETRRVNPATVMNPGRQPARRWRDVMPTVMASGPRSWS